MELVLTAHKVTGTGEHVAGTVVESDSKDTEHKQQPPLKTVVM